MGAFRRPRAVIGAALGALSLLAVVGGAVVGSASAPSETPPVVAAQPAEALLPAAAAEAAASAEAPERRTLAGVIVGVREHRIALQTRLRERPVVLNVRPATMVRINKEKASIEDLQPGDRVVVIGMRGPRGNLNARAIAVRRQ